MAASLSRVERLLYHNLDKEVVKAGPQAFADTGETLQVNNDNDDCGDDDDDSDV